MILEEWRVKDRCAGCGFPCRKSACVNYDAGLDLQCDACGKTWTVEAGSYLRDHNTHLCDACMKTAVGETLTVTLPSVTRAKPGHAGDARGSSGPSNPPTLTTTSSRWSDSELAC